VFWEDPEVLVAPNARFAQADSAPGLLVLAWQQFQPTGQDAGEVTLWVKTSTDGKAWSENRRFAGPYPYSRKEAPLFSLVVGPNGIIYIAVSADEFTTTVYMSDDGGERFEQAAEMTTQTTTVTPRLFAKDDGGLLLFVTQDVSDTLSIFYSLSEDAAEWTPFRPLVLQESLRLNFLPHHVSHDSSEFVVFQSLLSETQQVYQLYLIESTDGGRTWSEPVRITDFEEDAAEGERAPEYYDNQRPYLAVVDDTLTLVWERRLGQRNPQIYYARIETDGTIIGEVEKVTGGLRSCNFPRVVPYRDTHYVLWFDNERGTEKVKLAERRGVFWDERTISDLPGSSLFGRPVRNRDQLFVFWENRLGQSNRIALLAPDTEAPPPSPAGVNFREGRRAQLSTVRVRWNLPRDPSGIAGFSYLWSQEPDAEPPRELRAVSNTREARFEAEADGPWYFRIVSLDYAGNWSEPATLTYVRDTTPPGPVQLATPPKDEDGYLIANTFSVTWKPPEEADDIGGYSYDLRWVAPVDTPLGEDPPEVGPPPPRIQTREGAAAYRNRDNGLWAFTVSAIDSVGNVGPATTAYLRLNKYIPVTYISYVDAEQDELGRVTMRIVGRGFSVGGEVERVILDRDGQPPYDYTFPLEAERYRVVSDRVIQGPEVEDVDQGRYRVAVVHPTRGRYFTGPVISLESTGTVKFGDFRELYEPTWQVTEAPPVRVTTDTVVVWLSVALLATALVFVSRRAVVVFREARSVRLQAAALVSGARLPGAEEEERLREMRKRGIGLRAKFAMFISILVILVVLMVSIPLGFYMIDTQRQNLAVGLQQRAAVLLQSLTSGAGAYLPAENALELGLLPSQVSAMEDAVYTTITGPPAEGSGLEAGNYEYVWASNDPNLSAKIDDEELRRGISVINDAVSPLVADLKEQINRQAEQSVSAMAEEISRLSDEARSLALRGDQEGRGRLAELQDAIADLESRINERLARIADITGSVPEYDPESLSPEQTRFVFFRPIVYRGRTEGAYFHGIVRLEISTESILAEIAGSQDRLLWITGIVALIAVGIGVGGAMGLAAITIIPIKRLVRGVELIRDTEDKEELKDHVIKLRSRDELSVLADTVNQMTQGLARAAAANKDLIVGKEVQKMFIPLEKDQHGRKLTTGKEVLPGAEFFGYYEGAKGVSGDYFDFERLDDKHYAIIKCDVAGKGVPAALIMVEVATIFLDYFKEWSAKTHGLALEKLVYRMNDLLEGRGFKGRFAALTVSIVNVETGACYFCNAGDNIVHMYDGSKTKMVQLNLPKSPAAGVFPSDLVEMQSGFQQVKKTLRRGDVLFLFTDGLEEAKRLFRDASFRPIKPDLEQQEQDPGQNGEESFEELGIPRIYEIVDALYAKGSFRLEKEQNPVGEEVLEFDFSTCDGTVEDAVMALVAIEKVFRIVPDPAAGPDDRVVMDRKIDTFLKEHFRQYSTYFSRPVDGGGVEHEYVQFSHLKEDEQYDDLTVLGIGKL
jgi:methyl-accepting chemotaxis protein